MSNHVVSYEVPFLGRPPKRASQVVGTVCVVVCGKTYPHTLGSHVGVPEGTTVADGLALGGGGGGGVDRDGTGVAPGAVVAVAVDGGV